MLAEYQQTVDNWIKEYGVRYFSELTNLALLTEEVGELARLVARKYGDQSYKSSEDSDKPAEQIADEMADILFVLTCLANQMDIDLDHALAKNIAKKTSRDASRHKNNPKLSDSEGLLQ